MSVFMDAAATDDLFCAKILYAIDFGAQRWMSQCREAREDRSTVDDDIVDFSDITEEGLDGKFDRKLPPTFSIRPLSVLKTPRVEEKHPPTKRSRGGSTETKLGSVKNPDKCDEFKMRDDEDWSIFKNKKTVKWRPHWDEKSKMCPHWHSRGDCFKDCNNAASHVPCQEIQADKKISYQNYLKKLRKED